MIQLIKNRTNTVEAIERRFRQLRHFEAKVEFYKEFIANYKALDGKFKFTEAIDEDYIFYQLKEHEKRQNTPLYGMPFGIKDIINTRGLPTAMGSDIWRGFRAGNNARIVDEIFDKGGIIFSKTTTAEFAVHFITAEKTINPYNKAHITGTSSSGSAVAVACGALPLALGTQTAGSIIRPASFCGAYGFKPSFGALDRTGVLKTNDTLDTLGILGSGLSGIRKIFYNIIQKGGDYPFSSNYFNFFDDYCKKNRFKIGREFKIQERQRI